MNDFSKIYSREEILAAIDEFRELYLRRPIKDNTGGMMSSEMFATWFIIKYYQPLYIIESGVWKGLGTWFMRQACPTARIYCYDIDLSNIILTDGNFYGGYDMTQGNWNYIDPERTIIFVDDHVDDYQRLVHFGDMGYKQFIFEDNYPVGFGNSYSIRKAFHDNKPYLNKISSYYEFPPLCRREHTRFGPEWDFFKPEQELLTLKEGIFYDEAINYTYICHVMLA